VIAAYQSKREKLFHTEYAEIACIRETVYQMYRKVLRKYYKALMIIFNNSTDLAKKALDSARDAVTAQLES
jgi:predicted translin family RNA/ssDNA-binding protein